MKLGETVDRTALLKSFAKQLTLTREAIRLSPEYTKALNNLGSVQNKLGRYLGPSSRCNKTRLKPDFPEAHYNLGTALYNSGQFNEAAQSLQRLSL